MQHRNPVGKGNTLSEDRFNSTLNDTEMNMETQVATDLLGSMQIQIESHGLTQTDPAIACAVVCCCAIATICIAGCLLAEEQVL